VGTVARAVEEPADVTPASATAAPVNSTASFDAVHATAAAASVGALRAENVASVEQLRAEARLVGKARDALRGGNAALAIRQLDDAGRLFPGGGVRQEREALAIEALVRLGRIAEASRRARDFGRDFPGSPFAARVKSLTAGHPAP
jgi:outer membrane protein assembly factor BamD (BamD/ComL family)